MPTPARIASMRLGAGVNLTAGSYAPLLLDFDAATAPGLTFDPTDVVQIGVHIYSDGAPTTGETLAVGTYTFYVDTIVAE